MITYIIIGITSIISFWGFKDQTVIRKLSFNPYRIIKNNEWYRFITHGFVHGDTLHLLVNMFTFWSFGVYIESTFRYMGFGSGGFLVLYFGGMIIASVYDLIKRKDNPNYNSIGASGAVSAVLFSYILFNPLGKIYLFAAIPIPAILFGVAYLIYCQYMAKNSQDNINHNAHFYGAVFGFLYPILLSPKLLSHFMDAFTKF